MRSSKPVQRSRLNPDDLDRELDILAQLMDTMFRVPGLGWRFGLDPIIGLIPVVGDLVATIGWDDGATRDVAVIARNGVVVMSRTALAVLLLAAGGATADEGRPLKIPARGPWPHLPSRAAKVCCGS